ncbi:MAG: hypothetical protein VKI63_04280 [Cyanobium sp.]|nr:hypothetical protein [Cyanobium sp.]
MSAKDFFAERSHGQVDSTEYRDCIIQIHWSDDPDLGPPWEVHEGHGVVTEGSDAERLAGQLPVDRYRRLSPFDRNSRDFYYDMEASLAVAHRDRWGLTPDQFTVLQRRLGRRLPTTDEIRAEAVELDFQYLRAWCHDECRWLVADVVIDVRAGDTVRLLTVYGSLGGIASTAAAEELTELLEEPKGWIDENQVTITAIARSIAETERLRTHLTPVP